MVAVLLHGNPETPAIWRLLLERLTRTDVVTPQLPGFGCPVPDGFAATADDYVGWFVGQVEQIVSDSGPVDLVGHDWGGGIGMRAVALRPELFRSWVCDVLGLFHPDYVWHDFAQIWQTPGDGEAYFEQSVATPLADRIALYEAIGIPRPIADEVAAAGDELMGRCVLALYRSAAQPAMAEWGRALAPAATVPGLAIIAPLDPYVQGETLGAAVADELGARREVLAGQGHWWMLGDPATGAASLESFWSSI